MRMVPPRLQKRMVSSVHAGKRQFGVGHFGRPKGRARGQMGLKKHFGVSQIESKKNSKYFITFIPLGGPPLPLGLFLTIVASILSWPPPFSRGSLITLPLVLVMCVFLGSVV